MPNENLHRLITFKPDGSAEKVGEMKIEGGRIYHKKNHTLPEFNIWNDISDILHIGDHVELKNYIPHDRADRYTGVVLKENGDRNYISNEGTKLFENDLFQYTFKYRSKEPKISPVRWDTRSCAWFVKNNKLSELLSNDDYSGSFKITGIHGREG